MNLVARTLVSLVTVSSLAAVVAACGAPAESGIGSTSDALTIAQPVPPVRVEKDPPAAPTWPAANATYCSTNPSCSAFPNPGSLWTKVTPAEMAALGCVGPFGLEGEPAHRTGITFAVCYDSPAVRAQYELLDITCDTCLPALPAGEIYIDTYGPLATPNCPSGCPIIVTPSPTPVHGVGGGTKVN